MRKKPKQQSDAKPVVLDEPEVSDKERRWRIDQLINGGFSKHQAYRLSLLPGVDYRTAVGMLDAGADFQTIYEILS